MRKENCRHPDHKIPDKIPPVAWFRGGRSVYYCTLQLICLYPSKKGANPLPFLAGGRLAIVVSAAAEARRVRNAVSDRRRGASEPRRWKLAAAAPAGIQSNWRSSAGRVRVYRSRGVSDRIVKVFTCAPVLSIFMFAGVMRQASPRAGHCVGRQQPTRPVEHETNTYILVHFSWGILLCGRTSRHYSARA